MKIGRICVYLVANSKYMKRIISHFLCLLLLIISCYCSGQGIQAGVVPPSGTYVDIVPDDSVHGFLSLGTYGYTEEIYLDVDLDGTDDLLFQADCGGGMGGWVSKCRIFPLSPDIKIIEEPCTTLFISPIPPYDTTFVVVNAASALHEGAPIGTTNTFLPDTCYIWADFWVQGFGYYPRVSFWDNRGDRHVGFQITQTTDTIYGWIRGEVVKTYDNGSPSYPHWTLYLKDFAIDKLVNFNPSITASKGIILFPNPAETEITIDLSGLDKSRRQVRIFSFSGKTTYECSVAPDQTNLRLDVSGWTNGLYFLEIVSANERSSSRFVVQH